MIYASVWISAQEEPTKTLVEKLHRPPASLTGSFTVDQDNETVKFLEPMRVLTFQDTTVDDTRNKDNPDHVTITVRDPYNVFWKVIKIYEVRDDILSVYFLSFL